MSEQPDPKQLAEDIVELAELGRFVAEGGILLVKNPDGTVTEIGNLGESE